MERVSSLCLRIIYGFFDLALLPENTVIGPDSDLRLQLLLDDLGIEELADFVASSIPLAAPISGAQFEKCNTIQDVADLVSQHVKIASPLNERLFVGWADTTLPTIWTQELRGRLDGTCGSGYGKDQKMFSRLRRAAHELARPFVFHWKSLSAAQQRQALLQAAPIPLNSTDADLPVSLKLLPGVTLESLQVRNMCCVLFLCVKFK
jgi:hypothetical protein